MRSGRSQMARRQGRTALVLLLPCLLGMGMLLVYPLVTNIYYSFTNYNLLEDAQWVGWENYRFMFLQDADFWKAARNTLVFTVISVPVQIVWSVCLALLLTSLRRGSSVYRTLLYLPALLPPVAATVGFAYIFNPATGQVNHVLKWLGLPEPLWLHDKHAAIWVFILMVVWAAGNTLVVMVAGVLDVPAELYEAAQLDGAGALQRIRHITLPTLRPVIVFATVTGLIGALQLFTQPYVANGIASGRDPAVIGYPEGSTLFYTTWIYQQAFSFFHVGYASALSTMLFVVALAFTVLVLRIGNFAGEES